MIVSATRIPGVAAVIAVGAVLVATLISQDPITSAYAYLRSVAFVHGAPNVVVGTTFAIMFIVAGLLIWQQRPNYLDGLALLLLGITTAQLSIALLYVALGTQILSGQTCALALTDLRYIHTTLLLAVFLGLGWLFRLDRRVVAAFQCSTVVVSLLAAWNLVSLAYAGCKG